MRYVFTWNLYLQKSFSTKPSLIISSWNVQMYTLQWRKNQFSATLCFIQLLFRKIQKRNINGWLKFDVKSLLNQWISPFFLWMLSTLNEIWLNHHLTFIYKQILINSLQFLFLVMHSPFARIHWLKNSLNLSRHRYFIKVTSSDSRQKAHPLHKFWRKRQSYYHIHNVSLNLITKGSTSID